MTYMELLLGDNGFPLDLEDSGVHGPETRLDDDTERLSIVWIDEDGIRQISPYRNINGEDTSVAWIGEDGILRVGSYQEYWATAHS